MEITMKVWMTMMTMVALLLLSQGSVGSGVAAPMQS